MDAMRSAPSAPLGLLHAASLIAEKYDVRLIDARLSNPDELLRKELDDNTLFVGVTCHTGPMIRSALGFSKLVRSLSDIPIVWGGTHASLSPEQTLENPAIDICVIGEGEVTVLEVADTLAAGGALEGVKGIAYKKNGEIIRNEPRDLLPADQWPEAAYQLVDLSRYLPAYEGMRSLFFQASRGCPFECGFCYNSPFNLRKYRKLEAEKVLERLRNLRKTIDFEDVYFVDDNFFVDLAWAEAIGKGLAEMGLAWQVQGIDISALLRMDDNYVARIKSYGCRRLTLGVETASERMRRFIRKQGTKDDIRRAVSRFEGQGMTLYASFMVGFPTETKEEMRETVDLALELVRKHDFFRCSPFYSYSPYPGTRCLDAAVEDGYEPPKKLEDWIAASFDDYILDKTSHGNLGRAFFEGLNLVTLFIDSKVTDYSDSLIIRTLAAIYRPIARFRAKRLFFKFMPERRLLPRFFSRYTEG